MSVPFHRTSHGLTNQAIFENVDAMVYAEGGRRFFTMSDLESGAGDPTTLDSAFWATILRFASPHKKVRVRSVGNKTTLMGIAQLLVDGTVNRVIVAMDRDFDDRRGRMISHKNVLYTYGYSWENDVFNEMVLVDVIGNLAPPVKVFEKATDELKRATRELRRCFSTIVRLDHALATGGMELTCRGELERAVRPNEKLPPTVLRPVIAAELSRVRALQPTFCLGAAGCALVEYDLHGHTVSKWWLAHIHHLLRSHLNLKMNSEVVARLAISAFANCDSPSRQQYFRLALEIVW